MNVEIDEHCSDSKKEYNKLCKLRFYCRAVALGHSRLYKFMYAVVCNVQHTVTLSNLLKFICYHPIQLEQMLLLQSAVDSDQDSVSQGSLKLQNKERAYRQKLQAYQEAQQKQAQLVQKLQTKVTGN